MKAVPELVFFRPADNVLKKVHAQRRRCCDYTPAEERFLRKNWSSMLNHELARALNRSLAGVISKGTSMGLTRSAETKKSLRIGRQRKAAWCWTQAEKTYLIDHWQTMSSVDLAQQLAKTTGAVKTMGRTLGLKKTPEAIRLLAKRSNAGQFKKGDLPTNTIYGDEPVIRTRRNSKRGTAYQYIRIGFKQWAQYHRWLWETHHGPIPSGHLVVFKDGNALNVVLENLELITQKENALRNSGSLHLPDGYVASLLTVRNPDLRKELLTHYPELIELKRAQIQLNRTLYDNAKPAKNG